MASGKSTVGSRLSEMTGLPFLDIDAHLEARAGMSTPECFARLGEDGFRRLEREAIEESLSRSGPLIMALGGGAYMRADNRRNLRAAAFSIYLRLSPDEIVARLEGSDIAARPMLSSAPDWRRRARELAETRDAVYLGADLVIEAGDLTVDGLAGKIAAELSARDEFRLFFKVGALGVGT